MTTPSRPTSPLPKLRSGELRDQVLAALAAQAHRAFTVGELADALGGRSSGAVGNALQRLADAGLVALTSATPRRYQAGTPAGAAAAPAATSTAPPAPTAPAAVPVAGGSVPPRPGAVRRPNGDWYLPRRLAGGTDVEVLGRLRRDRIATLLYGPPGTGKTSLVEAAFPDVITIAGHGDTCAEDLLGSYVPLPDGGFEYSYGPLVTAMREGRALLLDDVTLISPKVLAVLYPAMDGRASITIAAHRNETVTAIDGFHVVAGHNPGVHGAILTEALASRFSVHIEVTTDFDLARSLGVPAKAVTAAANLNTQLRNGEISWAPQLRELLAFRRIADTLGTAAAVANLAAIAPDADRGAVLAALQTAFGRTITPLTLGEQR